VIRSFVLLPLFLATACKDKAADTDVIPVDDDGDGFYSVETGGDDCDDTDPLINPDAIEYCDGVDNNCNGDLDADDGGVVGTTNWYVDDDGDGYGVADLVSGGCEQPKNTVDNSDDCNDHDDDIYPGATEWCDEIDNDCDGDVDDDPTGSETWYLDSDGDGYGNADSSVRECAMPVGYSGDATDCDDGDANIYPLATETCGDGIDSDCDNWDGPSVIQASTGAECAQVRVYGEAAAGAGAHLVEISDADGDGDPDAMVGGTDAVWLISGPLSGEAEFDGDATAWATGTAGSGLGVAMAGINDGTGTRPDGVLFGQPGDATNGEGAGGVWLVPGNLSGKIDVVGDAGLVLLGGLPDERVGAAVVDAGDVDGSGDAWMLVGATGVADLTRRGGAVYLVSGALTGTANLEDVSSVTFNGDAYSYEIGAALVGDTDLNGDGFVDAVAASPGDDYAAADAGAIYALYGPVADGAWSANYRLRGASGGDNAGTSLSTAGDVDGDGYSDTWVSAPFADALAQGGGAVYLVRGPITAAGSLGDVASAQLQGPTDGDNAGTSVSGGGDINGDGTPDVVVGGPRESSNPGPGTAWVVFGPFSGSVDLGTAGVVASGRSDGDRFGSAVLLLSDVGGDGFDEVVVGADADSFGAEGGGAMYLFHGAGL
jgi:Putative metal-binding motif/FG-GAP repeat